MFDQHRHLRKIHPIRGPCKIEVMVGDILSLRFKHKMYFEEIEQSIGNGCAVDIMQGN